MITIAYINIWQDNPNNYYFTNFFKYYLNDIKIVNYYENPDILIASCTGNINIIKTIKSKCKLFFYGENLESYPPYNDEKLLLDTFDLIVGFKYTNIEKKQIRFPLWLLYYKFYTYTSNHNLISYIENKYIENKNKKKTIFATLVARHDREGQRSKICNELETHNPNIMYPGSFNNNTINGIIGPTSEDKINYISQSIYNICPENSKFEGYFTEKIIQAFEAGTIPLYWAINFPEQGLINENKYCFCNINNPVKLKEDINKAMTHPEYYLEGNVFTDDAPNILSNYYNTLISNIKIKLNL